MWTTLPPWSTGDEEASRDEMVLGITGIAKVDGLYRVDPGGACLVRISNVPLTDFLNSRGAFSSCALPTDRPLAALIADPGAAGFLAPNALRALGALDAELEGRGDLVDAFTRGVLGLSGGKRWQEAVGTALLGGWMDGLLEGVLGAQHLDRLRREAQEIHRQSQPLWEHRPGGARVIMLDAPLGDTGVTMIDLLASTADLAGSRRVWEPGEPRLDRALNGLEPKERKIALAWAQPGVVTWEEAAWLAGDPKPRQAGERVCRKLRRIGTRLTHLATEAAPRAR